MLKNLFIIFWYCFGIFCWVNIFTFYATDGKIDLIKLTLSFILNIN